MKRYLVTAPAFFFGYLIFSAGFAVFIVLMYGWKAFRFAIGLAYFVAGFILTAPFAAVLLAMLATLGGNTGDRKMAIIEKHTDLLDF